MATSYTATQILDAYPQLNAKEVEGRLAYGSFASVKDRFVYVAVPKAACTTMKMLLRELREPAPLKMFANLHHETRRNMFIHARENIPFPSLNALDKKEQRELLEAPDVLRFTVVRNPYTRLVSAWGDKVLLCEPSVENVYRAIRGDTSAVESKKLVQFAEFVSYIESGTKKPWDGHWRKQVNLTFPKGIPYTHIGKVEDLSSTIFVFGRHLGRQEAIATRHANERAIASLPQYSSEIAERVYALYKEDFITFGYEADSWPRDLQVSPRVVSEERFIDEVLERNLIIALLYSERERLMRDYNNVYRFSVTRIRNKFRQVLGSTNNHAAGF